MILAGLAVFVAEITIIAQAGYPTWRILTAIGMYAAFAGGHRIVISQTIAPDRVEHAFIKMSVMSQLFVVGIGRR